MRRLDALSNDVIRSTLAFDVDMFVLVTDYDQKKMRMMVMTVSCQSKTHSELFVDDSLFVISS